MKSHNKNVTRPLPKRIRIAVPPGVGDTYWVLCKLESFRRKHAIEHVTLCVKHAELKRALAWPSMVSCVDAAEEFDFETNPGIRETGFSCRKPGVDVVMWPNAVIDTGKHLSEWMPEYDLNLDIHIKTPPIPDRWMNRHLIYASSEGVNKEWFPDRGPGFWRHLINDIAEKTGERPLVIGAGWDKDFFRSILPINADDLIDQTTLPEVAGLIKSAKSLTGIISGMTILGNHFRTPTVAIYPDRFIPEFLTAWVKPDTPYVALKASKVPTSKKVAEITNRLAHGVRKLDFERAEGAFEVQESDTTPLQTPKAKEDAKMKTKLGSVVTLQVGQVWMMNNGERIMIEQEVSVGRTTQFYRGITQRGKAISYNSIGVSQFINGPREKFDLATLTDMEKDEFKSFDVGSLWVTETCGTVWEVLTFYDTTNEEFPIIANEVAKNGMLDTNIKRFNWMGEPHDGSDIVLWRKCS